MKSWKHEILAIATVAAIGVGGELLLDAGLAFSCFGLAVVLGRHLYLLHRLTAHLEHGRQLTPPPAGPWGAVFGAVLRLERKSRKWRRRFHRFQDGFIESAEAFPDAAVVLDKRGRIEWCNPASGALLGLQWPDVARRDFLETVRDPLLGDYIAAGRYHHPLHLPSPSQQAKVLSVRITPYRNKRKKLLIARDITRSFYLDRMREDFVANVSHELRTPVTVIRGLLELMETPAGDDADDDEPRSIEIMLEQTQRIEGIISDLLTLSRLESAAPLQDPACVPVATLLASVVEEARRLSGSRQHVFSLDADARTSLRGTAAELRSAFSNLIFNAVRHTPPRTAITVRWSADDDGATLSVSDKGEGIAARHIPRLTERFYRVDQGRSRETGGTGLGLAIVKHVLARHDAELNIASRVGYGSTFRCRFPASRVIKPSDEATGDPGSGGTLSCVPQPEPSP